MGIWRSVEKGFKRVVLPVLERFIAKEPVPPSQVNLRGIRKILVIRQHDQLGDFLLSTPVFRALRQTLPWAYIALVAREQVAEVAFANRFLDEVLVFYKSGLRWTPGRIYRLWKGLRRGYDLVIVLNTVSHSWTSDLLALLSGAPFVLGPSHLVFPGCRRNFAYNLLAPYSPDRKHQSQKNLEIVQFLGIHTSDLSEHVTLSPKEVQEARDFLTNLGIDSGEPLVGLHPGAGKLANRWPPEGFARVGDYCAVKYRAQILLFFGQKERALAAAVQENMRHPAVEIPPQPLRRLAAILSQLRLYVGNDTGTTHLAAAVGTPVVAIFGPTDSHQWKPWGDRVIAVQAQDGRCESIRPEEVIRAAEKLWELSS